MKDALKKVGKNAGRIVQVVESEGTIEKLHIGTLYFSLSCEDTTDTGPISPQSTFLQLKT